MKLPRTQAAVLEAASATETRPIAEIADETDENRTTITRAAFELEESGLLDIVEETTESVSLTTEGERYDEHGSLRSGSTAVERGAEGLS